MANVLQEIEDAAAVLKTMAAANNEVVFTSLEVFDIAAMLLKFLSSFHAAAGKVATSLPETSVSPAAAADSEAEKKEQ